jgi:hypothetical protein
MEAKNDDDIIGTISSMMPNVAAVGQADGITATSSTVGNLGKYRTCFRGVVSFYILI